LQKVKNGLILYLALMSVNAIAKVLFVDSHGFSVENKVEIKAHSEKVWQVLVNDVDLWWPKEHSWFGDKGRFFIESKAGGCFCEVSGDKSAEHMRISYVEPKKLLRMTGGLGPLQGMGMYGSMDWKFSETDGMTTLILKYKVSGYSPDGFEQLAPIVAKVQGLQLGGLKSYLENNKTH